MRYINQRFQHFYQIQTCPLPDNFFNTRQNLSNIERKKHTRSLQLHQFLCFLLQACLDLGGLHSMQGDGRLSWQAAPCPAEPLSPQAAQLLPAHPMPLSNWILGPRNTMLGPKYWAIGPKTKYFVRNTEYWIACLLWYTSCPATSCSAAQPLANHDPSHQMFALTEKALNCTW